ncbi:DUF2079 domain-containing protein [Lignipirellula cremea]|uniref:DUF2079 domain-containing protein n=1 Tax=Lignipirellula cremea TaxID=2528010 RepID=A0A518DLX9_9BACT|nr:DUF2079 domain-containing protein [Lignipirellula cremea]QDU92844.1 hypothetical protein Pla8534_06170 [Lignipirellula cremea]
MGEKQRRRRLQETSARSGSLRSEKPPAASVSLPAVGSACLAGFVWTFALLQVNSRFHSLLLYQVSASGPPLLGWLLLSGWQLLSILALGTAVAWGCYRANQTAGRALGASTGWILAAGLVPLLDLFRLAGVPLPLSLYEPLWLVFVTSSAVAAMAGDWFPSVWAAAAEEPFEPPTSRVNSPWWTVAAVGACVVMLGWWISEGLTAYHNFLLGHADFGMYARRLDSTWSGRGWLVESPGSSPFYDHFNPGLLLLTPFWGLAPTGQMLVVLQAFCLAAPGLCVYHLARGYGASRAGAAFWTVAWLLYPVTMNLNLNYSYGWHPVSVSLLAMFAAIAAWTRGRRWLALLALLLAGSMQEDVWAPIACLAFVLAGHAWFVSRRQASTEESLAETTAAGWPAAGNPVALLLAGAASVLLFLAIYVWSPSSGFQAGRFHELGDSLGAVLLSPLLRPTAFWGNLFRDRCLVFLLALFLPLGWRPLLRGGWLLLAAAPALAILLVWNFDPAQSIAHQYTSTLLPIFFFAAIVGAAGNRQVSSGQRERSLFRYGAAAAAAGLVGCAALSSSPWNEKPFYEIAAVSYPQQAALRLTPANNRAIHRLINQVRGPQARVLASGRLAAHLLDSERLEAIGTVANRWPLVDAEAAPGEPRLATFDWILFDLDELFSQSRQQMLDAMAEAEQAGFQVVTQDEGVVLMKRTTP